MKLDGILYVGNMTLAYIVCDPDGEDLIPVIHITPKRFQSWIDGETPFVNLHLNARLFKDGKEHVIGITRCG